jgi:hypothetical protein
MRAQTIAMVLTVPPVPSTAPIYKGTSTTTTDETDTTFSGLDIGTPHPYRLVVLGCYHGSTSAPTATINGTAANRIYATGHECAMFWLRVPTGLTATVVVSATSSLRKAIGLYVAYPRYPLPIDFGTATANTTSDATVTNVQVQAGGFVVMAGGQHATLGAFTTTFGAQSVTEDVDAQLEAAASYSFTSVANVGTSESTATARLAETVSGTKRFAVASWGPCC